MLRETWVKTLVVALAFVIATFALAGCSANRSSESAAPPNNSESSELAASSSGASDDAPSASASSGSESSSASRSQSSSASSKSTTASMATAVAEFQTVGNDGVGYVQVPSDWEDRVDDLAVGTVDAYKIVYYADPSTKYGSKTLGHDSFAKAIQLIVAQASSAEMATDIAADFKRNSSTFSLVESRDIVIGERPATLVMATMTEDDLRVATIVMDRDGDGHTAIAITMNCGNDEASFEEALARANTWSLQLPVAQEGTAAEQEAAPVEAEEGQEALSQQ